jgi:hypothetical protein
MAEFNECKTPDADTPWDGKGLPPGVRPALLGLFGAILVVGVPYALAPLVDPSTPAGDKISEMRIWIEGDPLPFSKHFRVSRPKPHAPVETAQGAAPEQASATAETAGTADNPEVPAAPAIAVVPEPPPTGGQEKAPVENPLARIKIPEATWEGLTVFIEDPSGALSHFYGQLAKVALKEPQAMVRISHFGDSAIAADGMPSSARRLLQRTFGDGGHGFSLVTATTNWYRRKDIVWESSGFSGNAFISGDAKDARYGLGGTIASGTKGAKAVWKTIEETAKPGDPPTVGARASRFSVHYLADKKLGEFGIFVDGVEKKRVPTESDTLSDKVETVEVEDGPHTFEIRVLSGRVKVYGAVIERASGVVYDGLGTIGARDTRWSNYDPDHAKSLFSTRGTDLATFMYGGNQLEDKVSMERYRTELEVVVKRWREGLGERSCLLMSPIDHGERYRGRVRTVPRQVEIMKVQREVALASGCAWFSLYDAMGGNGIIGDWFEQGLAEGDLAHPTAKGAVVLGQLFYKALMKGFAEYLERTAKAH